MKTFRPLLLAVLAASLWAFSPSVTAGELIFSQHSDNQSTYGPRMIVASLQALANVSGFDAGGETITVTTLNDVSDFSGAQQVNDLPGPDGRVSFC